MRFGSYFLIALLTCALPCSSLAGEPVIDSFHGNGELTVSGLESNTFYRVEWADTPGGSWRRSWQALDGEEAGTNTTMTFQVPMFFRFAGTTHVPPAGMAFVEGGPFQMGDFSGEGDPDERPVHEVEISAFLVDRYEMSNEKMRQVLQWAHDQGLIGASASTVTNQEGQGQELIDLDDEHCQLSFAAGTFAVDGGKEGYPCVEVTWYGAQACANYRSDREGLDRCVDFSDWSCDFAQNGYRLPTEAEWEKAARGGLRDHHYPWPGRNGSYTNHVHGGRANYYHSGDPDETGSTPVGYFNGSQTPPGVDEANGFTLYDMAGNVWEWCWDWHQSDWYARAEAVEPDPTGPAIPQGNRVMRGGSFDASWGDPVYLRCAEREPVPPDDSSSIDGFRCVRRP